MNPIVGPNPFYQYFQWYWNQFQPDLSTTVYAPAGPSTGPSWDTLVTLLSPQPGVQPNMPVDWSGIPPDTFPVGGPYIPEGGIPTFPVTVWGDPVVEPPPPEPPMPEPAGETPTFPVDVWSSPLPENPPLVPEGGPPIFTVDVVGEKPQEPEEPPVVITWTEPVKPEEEGEPQAPPPPPPPPPPPEAPMPVPEKPSPEKPKLPPLDIKAGGGAPLPGNIPGPVGNTEIIRSLFKLLSLAPRIPTLGEILASYGGQNVNPAQR